MTPRKRRLRRKMDCPSSYGVVEVEINLEDLTKKELLEYAKALGLEVNSKMTKATLIEICS